MDTIKKTDDPAIKAEKTSSGDSTAMTRRNFLSTSAVAGAGIALVGAGMSRSALGQTGTKIVKFTPKPDDLKVGIIGLGAQGLGALFEGARRIPGIRFTAVCDIWDYNRKRGAGTLRAYGHVLNNSENYGYTDYKEMLDAEKDKLDAVIVATPDWMHAEHAIACMEAGLHVYCEKEMSNSLEKAKQMVETSNKTGKLLQIGHQRRSNPRYRHAIENLIHGEDLLGYISHAYGQWNRSISASVPNVCHPRDNMPPEMLDKYGYGDMERFLNWRWYRKFGGGPIVDLGSHQIDIFAWVFGSDPKSVVASGGTDYWKGKNQWEWYDNVLSIFEYDNKWGGTSRAFYQTLTTTSHGGFVENFMGDQGTLEISEVPSNGNQIAREANAPEMKWNELARRGFLSKPATQIKKATTKNVALDVRVTPPSPKWPIPVELSKPAHQPHLENFFDAIRLGKELHCPGKVGYETAVAVLAVNRGVESGEKINFHKEEFEV